MSLTNNLHTTTLDLRRAVFAMLHFPPAPILTSHAG